MVLSVILRHKELFRYISNITWLMSEGVFSLLINFVVAIYVARYLGPDQLGILSYAISFVVLASAITNNFAADNLVSRELVNHPEEKDAILGTAFHLKLLGACFSFLIIYFATKFTSNDGFTNLLILIIAAELFFRSFNVIDSYFRAKVLSKYFVLAKIIQALLSSTLKLFLVHIQAPLLCFALVVLFDGSVLFLGLLFVYLKQGFSVKSWKFKFATAKILFKNSFLLIFAGLSASVYMRIDQIMIKEFLTPKEIGYYAVAAGFCEALYFIPTLITNSFFPAILDARKINKNLYYHRLQRLYDLMTILALLLIIPISIFSDKIIDLLFGQQFSTAGNVLRIYIWSNLFIFLEMANGKWLLAENLQKYSFFKNFLGAVINILLNLFLIPKFGISGAAYATLISYASAHYFILASLKACRLNFIMNTRSFNLFHALKRIVSG